MSCSRCELRPLVHKQYIDISSSIHCEKGVARIQDTNNEESVGEEGSKQARALYFLFRCFVNLKLP